MSKGIILYQSKYGATKKYAGWLVERIGYDCVETKNAKVADLKNYDVIILGGGVYASGIAGLQFIKKNIGQLADKKLAVFAVGASPYDKKAIMQIREMHFRNELRNIPLFYCRGAWDEEKMKFADRTLCKMLQKAVAKQNPDEYEPYRTRRYSIRTRYNDREGKYPRQAADPSALPSCEDRFPRSSCAPRSACARSCYASTYRC